MTLLIANIFSAIQCKFLTGSDLCNNTELPSLVVTIYDILRKCFPFGPAGICSTLAAWPSVKDRERIIWLLATAI